MEQNRTLTELELNRSVDVVWSMASAEREARMLPIRIGILLAATTPLERNQLWQTPEQLHKLSNSKPH